MKRRELEKRLRLAGCILKREGMLTSIQRITPSTDSNMAARVFRGNLLQ